MKITKSKLVPESITSKGKYHLVTFAETGFAALSYYGEMFKIDHESLENFSSRVNENDESGSLYPKAPISIIPRRYIRDMDDSDELKRVIVEFLKMNMQIIHAKRILLDFSPVYDTFVIQACENALKSPYAKEILEAVIIDK